jgi:hypothetical protein
MISCVSLGGDDGGWQRQQKLSIEREVVWAALAKELSSEQ